MTSISGGMLASALLAALVAAPALAADEPDELMPGRTAIVKPGVLAKVVAKPPTGATFDLPNTGVGGNDPTLEGGSLNLFDMAGPDNDTYPLPAGGWKALGNPPGSTGFKFRGSGSPGDPCRVVLVKTKVVKAVCRGAAVTLTPTFLGDLGVVLSIGTDTKRYCAQFGGTIRRNEVGRFIATRSSAPAVCPGDGPAPSTTSSTVAPATTTSTSLAATTTSTVPGATTSSTLPPTTTTSSTPVSSTTSTTVAGLCCNGAEFLTFTSEEAPGDCGDLLSVDGSLFNNIACSGLYFGGGQNSVPLPASIPDLAVQTVRLTSCTGQSATLGATNSLDTGTPRTCSDVGCLFGAPLSVPNANSTPTSTCVINRVAGPADGSLNCSSGDATINLPLASEVFLTGDQEPGVGGIQPCPRCVSGLCTGGTNNGMACTPGTSPLNPSYPTSHDCPPDPMFSLGDLPIGFSLTTGVVSWTGTVATNDDGSVGGQARVFAGFCRDADATGAFANPSQKCWENGVAVGPACVQPFETCQQRDQGAFGPAGGAVRTINTFGSPLAGILSGAVPATLVSVFGVPPTFDPTVDAAGNLPGPGAAAIPGIGELCETVNPCMPPVIPTTTTLPGATTTSTTLNTTTSSVALTTTSTSTSTTSTLFPGCPPPANPLGAVTFVTELGTTDCGGPGLNPAPLAPFSGTLTDANAMLISNLGAGCLNVGGGLANAIPPAPAPDGAEAHTNVGSIAGTMLTLASSNGTGVINCTRGAGPGRSCVNGTPGTNGMGLCTTDADCGQGSGNCLPDANCYFGPPIPISPPTPALATCIVNPFTTDVCGALDTATLSSSLNFGLSTRLYLTQNPTEPCPLCQGGVCTAGARQGLACSGGVGSFQTSNECPPSPTQFVGSITSNPIAVSTGTSVMTADADGFFCPGQTNPGAFGTGVLGRTITQAGALSGGGSLLASRFAGNICAASSGNPLIDTVEDLPGPISLSFAGTLGVCVLPDICNTLCSPCNLGPLCDVVCAPCILCTP
jgi:hypothetical protein